jgi:hypothetical protein
VGVQLLEGTEYPTKIVLAGNRKKGLPNNFQKQVRYTLPIIALETANTSSNFATKLRDELK